MAAILQPGGRTERVTEEWMQSPNTAEPVKQVLIIKCINLLYTYVHKLCKSLMAKLFPVLLLRSQSLPRRRMRGVQVCVAYDGRHTPCGGTGRNAPGKEGVPVGNGLRLQKDQDPR